MKRCALLLLLFVCAASVRAQEEPTPLNVYYGEIPEGENTYFVAPNGNDDAPGTEEEPWATLDYAVLQVGLGDVIVMRGGVYEHNETIRIGGDAKSGYFDQLIVVTAYPGEVPILEFSSQPKERNVHGIRLNANWWHLIGLTLRNASHNGIRMDGSYNILEQITAYGNHDTGIHMAGGASYNLVKNSDSFHNFNYDPARNNGAPIGGNADGFSAKFSIGPGNRYVGCRGWENSDDGWDFWEAENTIIIDSSWAFGNGDSEPFGNPEGFNGNGNGFKLGGGSPPPQVPHVIRRSLAFDNFGTSENAKGFDYNGNGGAMTVVHNTAFNNGRNFFFPAPPPTGQGVFINNLSAVSDVYAYPQPDAVVAGNSWQSQAEVSADIFQSIDRNLATAPRETDGSLPESDFLQPVPGSFAVDGGLAIGQPFYGEAPDMGAFEYTSGDLIEGWVTVGSEASVSDLTVFDIENGGQWAIATEAAAGAQAYGDADATFTSLPHELNIDAWIQTALATRTKNYLFPAAQFTTAVETQVFVAHSDEITHKPTWLSEFTETPLTMTITGAEGDRSMTLFRKIVDAGEIVALGRNSTDGTSAAPMYVVLLGSADIVAAEGAQPERFGLDAIYPNPISSSAILTYSLERAADVSVRVYDGLGREVAVVVDRYQTAGTYTARWNAESAASGVYYVRMTAGGFSEVRKVLRIR